MAYCDIGEDLFDVYPQLRGFQEKWELSGWVSVSGQSNTYAIFGCGYIEQVFDDGQQLTIRTSIADVQSNAGSWYYVADTDILYVHAVDSDDLTGSSIPLIEGGVDWDAFKTRIRNQASEYIDGWLNNKYATPLLPRIWSTHVTDHDYDAMIVRACACLTVALILRRRNIDIDLSEKFYKEVYNKNPEDGEEDGIINQLINGDLVLQDQISPREVGSFNVYPDSSNSGTGYIRVDLNVSSYTGAQYMRLILQIDTAGAIGTATWKISRDGGTNWDVTLQKTFDTNNKTRRIHIGYGMYVIFWGTFVLNDKWTFELFPTTDKASISKIGSIEMTRG